MTLYMPNVVTFLFFLSGIVLTLSKTFTRCDLVMELKRQGFPENQLDDWVCLVEAESSRNTSAIGGPDADGSYDYGLFQINDRYWCSTGETPGKSCSVLCADLLSDDITEASQCAKKIYRIHGFYAWVGWVDECKGKNIMIFSNLTC